MSLASSQREPTPASEEQLQCAALQAFFGIARDWKLSVEQQQILLGSLPRSTFFKLKKELGGRLSVDTLDRVSYVMGIHKALRILLPEIRDVARWISAPNDAPLFGGRSALDVMLSGHMEDLAAVRRYLDAERG